MTEIRPSTEQAEVEDPAHGAFPNLGGPRAQEMALTEEGAPPTGPVPVDVADEPVPSLAELGLHLGELAAGVDWGRHADALARWRQGHLVDKIPVSWMAPPGVDPMTGQDHELGKVAPFFLEDGIPALVCTQTCDLGGKPPGSHHPFVQVAPLVHGSLLDNGVRKLAGNWQVGYLVPVNSPFSEAPADEPVADASKSRRKQPPHEWFADLRLITPVSKALLLDRTPVEGFGSEELYQIFAETLGYKFRRPALHDALSEIIPDALDTWVKKQGKSKTYIANVEHVRVLVLEGTALTPTRAQFFVITNGIELTEADVEAWQRFQAIAADSLRPHDITVGPIRCTDISGMKADLYRRSTPVPSDLLNAPGFP